MNHNVHHCAITNFTTDQKNDGMFFYTLAKYWMENHERPVQAWEADEGQEFYLEARSYVGPAPCRCEERKYVLTPSQYSLLLFEVAVNGPEASHTYIERNRPSWAATT